MPELVACPACGCRFQVIEGRLGQRTRCFACNHIFGIGVDTAQDRVAKETSAQSGSQPSSRTQPLCPVCQRPVSWNASACAHCGEPFEREPEELIGRDGHGRRRDCEAHRGRLIAMLGTVSMFFGGLALCFFGLGVLISGPLGVAAWVMANRDLALMRAGLMDPQGRPQTENGRAAGIVGLFLGVLFALFGLLFVLAH
jgi:hypothetical protein